MVFMWGLYSPLWLNLNYKIEIVIILSSLRGIGIASAEKVP
ncbi:hypothetical protein ES705_35837 [subsurface metagenome]